MCGVKKRLAVYWPGNCIAGIVLIGEIGGTAEEDAAALIKVN